jgi:hypothetical protein
MCLKPLLIAVSIPPNNLVIIAGKWQDRLRFRYDLAAKLSYSGRSPTPSLAKNAECFIYFPHSRRLLGSANVLSLLGTRVRRPCGLFTFFHRSSREQPPLLKEVSKESLYLS